jgi:hypothetical protein
MEECGRGLYRRGRECVHAASAGRRGRTCASAQTRWRWELGGRGEVGGRRSERVDGEKKHIK